MPIRTLMRVPATEIVKGDFVYDKFTGLGNQNLVADKIKRGHKYVTILNANSQVIGRTEIDLYLNIDRMMPTEEEIAAKKAEREIEEREYFSASVEKWVNVRINGWVDYVTAQAKILVEFPGQTYHSPIDNLMEEGARVLIARNIAYIHSENEQTWADSFDVWAENSRRSLIEGVGFTGQRALSRNSSVITNLTDDVMAAAIRRLLDSVRYGHI